MIDGTSERSNHRSKAVRWTESEGMVGLGFLSGMTDFSDATLSSLNRDVIVGFSQVYYHPSGAVDSEAFRWTVDGGMQGLGHLRLRGLHYCD